jgi:hypothetical protein
MVPSQRSAHHLSSFCRTNTLSLDGAKTWDIYVVSGPLCSTPLASQLSTSISSVSLQGPNRAALDPLSLLIPVSQY